MSSIQEAASDEDILRCFPVLQQLRTHLVREDFVARVRRQQRGGYRLAFLEDAGRVQGVAGFRVMENFFSGRVLYVDDLVTDASTRSRGYGKTLLHWLAETARTEDCQFLELDSGVQRLDAHRFYLANGMAISSHHFRLKV